MILNGSFNKGGWTYIGEVGVSIVDYVIANEKAEEIIKKVTERSQTTYQWKWNWRDRLYRQRGKKIGLK